MQHLVANLFFTLLCISVFLTRRPYHWRQADGKALERTTDEDWGVERARPKPGAPLPERAPAPTQQIELFSSSIKFYEICLSVRSGHVGYFHGDLATLTIDSFAAQTLNPTAPAFDVYNFGSNKTVPAGQSIILCLSGRERLQLR